MKDSIINQPHQYVYACTMQTFICIWGERGEHSSQKNNNNVCGSIYMKYHYTCNKTIYVQINAIQYVVAVECVHTCGFYIFLIKVNDGRYLT